VATFIDDKHVRYRVTFLGKAQSKKVSAPIPWPNVSSAVSNPADEAGDSCCQEPEIRYLAPSNRENTKCHTKLIIVGVTYTAQSVRVPARKMHDGTENHLKQHVIVR
jgi:hypothetical protein